LRMLLDKGCRYAKGDVVWMECRYPTSEVKQVWSSQ
jgi:hypothetical protein